MQIAQFVVGTLLAAAHLFFTYTIPVQDARPVSLHPLTETIPAQDASGLFPWLKKLAFRAAGADGVASNVLSANRTLFGSDGAHAAHALINHRELRHETRQAPVPCINTSGQAFAIWLNIVYLLPLTFLFVRFFIRSYLRRSNEHQHHAAEKAIKDVTREITNAVSEMHGITSDGPSSGSSTPRPEKAYEANVLDLLTRKQRIAERDFAQPSPSAASSTAIDLDTATPRQQNEPNLKQVMHSHPEQSPADTAESEPAASSPPTPLSHSQRRKKKAGKRH